jgi:hypothetical protein
MDLLEGEMKATEHDLKSHCSNRGFVAQIMRYVFTICHPKMAGRLANPVNMARIVCFFTGWMVLTEGYTSQFE